MATIVDALIVTLGLDGANFRRGSAEARQSMRDTTQEAGRTARELDAKGRQAAQFFASIKTEALSLLAVLTAGAGLKSFIKDSVTSSAEMGRLAKNIGLGTEAVSAWQGAAARNGGTADAMAATLRNVSGELAKFKMGLSSDFVAWFARGGGDFTTLRDASSTLIEMSRIISALDAKDPGKALLVAGNLGVDEKTFNFLRQGPQLVQAQIDAQVRLGTVTKADSDAAQALQSRMEALNQSSQKLGRDLLTKAAPGLEWLLGKMTDLEVFAQRNGPAIEGFFITVAAAIALPMAPMLALTAAVAAVAVGVEYVYQEWLKWTDGGTSSLSKFFIFIKSTWALVAAIFTGTGGDISKAWNKVFDDLGLSWDGLIDKFRNAGPAILGALKDGLGAAFAWAQGRVTAIWDAIHGRGAVTPDAPAAASGAPRTGPRGIRNNNPGNLNFAGQAGATKEASAGGRFAVFGNMEQGVAALVRQLQLYASRGIDTITAIVQKYAPSSENNVPAYIAALVKATGIDPNKKLDLGDLSTLTPLLKGIVAHENGAGYVSDAQINAGARMAAPAARYGGNTNSSEVRINQMTIQTQATDAAGIARDAAGAFRAYPLIVPQANTGVN